MMSGNKKKKKRVNTFFPFLYFCPFFSAKHFFILEICRWKGEIEFQESLILKKKKYGQENQYRKNDFFFFWDKFYKKNRGE